MSEKVRKVRKVRKAQRESLSIPADAMIPRAVNAIIPNEDALRPHNEVFVDRLYNDSKALIKDIANGASNIVEEITDLGASLMQGVAIYPGLTGMEKKIIVLKVLRMLVSEIPMTAATNNIVGAVITFVVPHMIDLVVSAADGSLDLNRKWKSVKKFWNACTGICGCNCCPKCVV